MRKTIAIAATILLCTAGANARSMKFSDKELAEHGGAACFAEIDRAAKSAQDAATVDKNGNPRTPTGVYTHHDHKMCEQWDEYLRIRYPNPSGN
jgi:hypothetical protein